MAHNPNERSTLRKIQTILGCSFAARTRINSSEDLIKEIEDARAPAFTYFRAHKRRTSEIAPCSKDLIRRRVRLCIQLGLVGVENGHLTRLGRAALTGEHLRAVVGRQAYKLLIEKGFSTDLMRPGIFRGSEGVSWLPTAQALFEKAEISTSLQDFRLLLNLLAECNVVAAVQSRIYLSRTG